MDKKDIKKTDINSKEKLINNKFENVVKKEESPTNSNSKKSNDLFFEKFNKSKKDFKKENKNREILAKKEISTQFKISGLSKKLDDNVFTFKVYAFILISFFITVGFAIAIFTVLLPYTSSGTYDANNVSDIWARVNYIQYPNFALASVVLSGIIFILLPAPYLYLMATWFVGINQVTRNKYFVMTNLYLTLMSIIFFIIILILSTIIFVAVSAPLIEYPADPLP